MLSIDILTMYKNDIKLQYIEYVERYVNVVWKKKFNVNKVRKMNISQKEKKRRVNKLCSQSRNLKIDLLNIGTDLKSYSLYHGLIEKKSKSFPQINYLTKMIILFMT